MQRSPGDKTMGYDGQFCTNKLTSVSNFAHRLAKIGVVGKRIHFSDQLILNFISFTIFMLIKYASAIQKQKVIEMKVVFRMNLSGSCTVDCLADNVA